jgi:hypothetical protein
MYGASRFTAVDLNLCFPLHSTRDIIDLNQEPSYEPVGAL